MVNNMDNLEAVIFKLKQELIAKGYQLTDSQLNTVKEILQQALNYNIKTIEKLNEFINQSLLNQCEITDIYFSCQEGQEYVERNVRQLIEGSKK